MKAQKPLFYLNTNDSSSLLAFGSHSVLRINKNSVLNEMQKFINENTSKYIFGFISYDIKNEIENLVSLNNDEVEFPLVYLFVPTYVVKINGDRHSYIQGKENKQTNSFINDFLNIRSIKTSFSFDWKKRTSKKEYLNKIALIKEHIRLGDIYELNYCQEFYADNVNISNPLEVYQLLNKASLAPFSSFLSFDDLMVFSASPERFIKKENNKLYSEPIKGTAPRGKDKFSDDKIIKDLKNSPKDHSENVMIVDLVRNDLSRVATPSSVEVNELCNLYTFKTVHQLISKISCEVPANVSFTDILRATFPMGSMTGAPKISAMKISEEMEDFKRGLYSGSIGYIKPNGDFDFNVVIRSLLYNASKKHLSCPVGGAITIESNAEKEYEECLTKVGALMNLFNE